MTFKYKKSTTPDQDYLTQEHSRYYPARSS